MDNPRPIPSFLVVKKGSNRSFSSSGLTPRPESVTETRRVCGVFSGRLQDDFPGAVGHLLDRLNTVDHQIENHLLQLNAVAGYRGQILGQLARQVDVVDDCLTGDQGDNALHEVVEIYLGKLRGTGLQMLAQLLNDTAGPLAAPGDVLKGFLDFTPNPGLDSPTNVGLPGNWS